MKTGNPVRRARQALSLGAAASQDASPERHLPASRPRQAHGLLVPVVRATPQGAAEVQLILEVEGIRSAAAPSEPARSGRARLRDAGSAQVPVEVLVFPEDAQLARGVIRACTRQVSQ